MIYLDYNATSPLNDVSKKKIIELIDQNLPLNPSSTHFFGRKARDIIEKSKNEILITLGLLESHDIIFTSSGTESNNQIIQTFKDNEIVISAVEHQSISKPAIESNAKVISVDECGIIDLNQLEDTIKNKKTGFLTSIIHGQSETGVVQDLIKIVKIIKKHGGYVHSDMSQSFGKVICNVRDIDLDYITISGHKIGGLVGCSALVYKKNVPLKPIILGGGQQLGLRSSTENILAISTMAESSKYVSSNLKEYILYTSLLRNAIDDFILKIDGSVIAKNTNRLPNTTAICLPKVSAKSQLMFMDMNKIAISYGSACSSGSSKGMTSLYAMGIAQEKIDNTVRISCGIENKDHEISFFIKKIEEMID